MRLWQMVGCWWVLSTVAAIRVAVVGDAGDVTEYQRRSFAAIRAAQPDVVVALGDNFYERGLAAPNPTEEARVWGALNGLQIWGILGNHDQLGDRAAQTFVPAPYYQRTLAPGIRLIALDTSTLFFPRGIWNPKAIAAEPQWQWLAAQLHEPKPAGSWRIVMGHHPVHSSTKHCSEQRPAKERLAAMLEGFGQVDLYLSGHTHCYERCETNATHYAVVGSTARLNTIRTECPYEHSCHAVHEHGWALLDLQVPRASANRPYFTWMSVQ